VIGRGLESSGSRCGLRISGWAPRHQMYETVIWRLDGSAVLPSLREDLRKTKRRSRVRRGSLGRSWRERAVCWTPASGSVKNVFAEPLNGCTIHVLTEVASYAAFALAMGWDDRHARNLTATYRRFAQRR